MRPVLLDTHAWAWLLSNDSRLSKKATYEVANAQVVFVSPITFFEIGQKVRFGKWVEMEPFVERLSQLLIDQDGRIAQLTPEICLTAAILDWSHRDPFDRILAASAFYYNLPIISADEIFDQLKDRDGWAGRIW